MCSRSAYLHLIVAADEFRLLSGADDLVEYSFGTGVAKHRFCRHCGVKSFYVPRSHPDGYSVNARCLDPSTITSMTNPVVRRPRLGNGAKRSGRALAGAGGVPSERLKFFARERGTPPARARAS